MKDIHVLIDMQEEESIKFSEEIMADYIQYLYQTAPNYSDANLHDHYKEERVLSQKNRDGMSLSLDYQVISMHGTEDTFDSSRAYPLTIIVCGPALQKKPYYPKIPEDKARIVLNNYVNFTESRGFGCSQRDTDCFSYAMDLKRMDDRCFGGSFLMNAKVLMQGKIEEGRIEPLMIFGRDTKQNQDNYYLQEISVVLNGIWVKTDKGSNFLFDLYRDLSIQ